MTVGSRRVHTDNCCSVRLRPRSWRARAGLSQPADPPDRAVSGGRACRCSRATRGRRNVEVAGSACDRREPRGRRRQYRRRCGRKGGPRRLHAADVLGGDSDRQPVPLRQDAVRSCNAFTPISVVAAMSMLVVVHPKVEATNLQEFVALARSRPEKINFGSPGVGTTGHLGLGAVHARGRHQAHPCAVPRGGAGGKRPHRGTDRWRGRQSADGASAYHCRQAAPACGRGQTAPCAAAATCRRRRRPA